MFRRTFSHTVGLRHSCIALLAVGVSTEVQSSFLWPLLVICITLTELVNAAVVVVEPLGSLLSVFIPAKHLHLHVSFPLNQTLTSTSRQLS